jgi:hypothetical protein
MENILDNSGHPLEIRKFYLIDDKICRYLGIAEDKYMFSDFYANAPIFKSLGELRDKPPILSQMDVVDNHGNKLIPQYLYFIDREQYRYLGQNGDEYMFRNTSNKDIIKVLGDLIKKPPMFLKVGGKRLKNQKNKSRKRNKSRRVKRRRTKRY